MPARTWSASRHIFGELHGQAFEGLAVDATGRVHFIGQIRYPMGIYHAYWDQNHWSTPSLFYLIASEEGKDFGDLIAAHNTVPVVRAGNQLVITLADNPSFPNRRLFAMHRILDDVPALELVPTPTPTASPIPVPSPTTWQPTPTLALTPNAPGLGSAVVQSMEQAPGWGFALQVAILPTLLLLAGIVVFQLWFKARP